MTDYTPIDALCDGYVMPEKRAEPHPFVKAEFAEWCGYCGAPESDPRHTNITASALEFHLPGKHNQKDHAGKRRARASSGGGGGRVDTLTQHTGPNGQLDPDRAALHDKIVGDMLAGHGPSAHPTALFLGGGPASGKSTILSERGAVGVRIDADVVKAKIPEYQRGIKSHDPDAAALVHEESSVISGKVMRGAIDKRTDFTLDGTGDSDINKLRSKVDGAKAAGYSVKAVYVTVDTDTAISRSDLRAERTGRVVPHATIRAVHAGVSDTFQDAVHEDVFDDVELWDTSGTRNVLVVSKKPGGTLTVHDPAAWDRFKAKGTRG